MRNCRDCLYAEADEDKDPCLSCTFTGSAWVDKHLVTGVEQRRVDVIKQTGAIAGTSLQYKPQDVAFNKRALDVQVAGSHYKDLTIQPVEYIHANGIGYFEGNVIKYVSRWRNKNGVKDLEKAKHYIDLLIELEGKNND